MSKNRLLYKVLSVFFVVLLIAPCFGLLRENRNRELIGEMENRMINQKPNARMFSAKYFAQFEAWFNDRILGRKQLIRGWSAINGKLFNVLVSREIAQGKDGFLFMPFNVVDKVIDIDPKLETLKKIDNLCKTHNARFVVFMAPHGEWALGELLPEKYRAVDLLKLDSFLDGELDKLGIQHISINKDLGMLSLSERKSMYYPGDYHWNSKGAFWAAKKILNALGIADNINRPVFYIKEKSVGDIYTRKVGWSDIVSIVDRPWSNSFTEDFEQSYTVAGVTKHVNSGIQMRYTQSGEEIYKNPLVRNKVKVLILGDSFASALKQYLLQDVETIVLTHNIDISSPKKNIDINYLLNRYKPDIVIYEKMGAFFYGHHHNDVFGTMKL